MKRDDSTHTEAVHLAEEAVEALRAGDKDEAAFVLEQARRLDPEAVEDVLHGEAKATADKPDAERG